jgi:hypothetical protein
VPEKINFTRINSDFYFRNLMGATAELSDLNPWLYHNTAFHLFLTMGKSKSLSIVDKAFIFGMEFSINNTNACFMRDDLTNEEADSFQKLLQLGLICHSSFNGQDIIRLHPFVSFYDDDIWQMSDFEAMKLEPFKKIGYFKFIKKFHKDIKSLKSRASTYYNYEDDFGGETLTKLTEWHREIFD